VARSTQPHFLFQHGIHLGAPASPTSSGAEEAIIVYSMKNLVSTIAKIWRLSLPYFRSEDRWPARILLAAIGSP
jgi:hypothetical protein